ncbi:TIGR01906 family membrane protein [Oscillospiraceae bacterium HV4-5-C5C]|nr:TIGR01906 family membrane protein [Oscillospiraceae bacterium HV4-5-C5C]
MPEPTAAAAAGTKPVWSVFSFIWGLCVVIFIVTSSVDFFCFFRPFYRYVYQRLNTAATVGLSEADLTRGTDILLDYLKDRTDSLDLEVTDLQTGQPDQMFDEREKAHMVDVKALYQHMLLVKRLTGIFVLLWIGLLFWRQRERVLTLLKKGYLKGLAVAGAALSILLGLAVWDFDRFWTAFHHLFFHNDLWLLDPATERMINMVPSYFFNRLVIMIVVAALLALALIALLLSRLKKWQASGRLAGGGV